MFFGPRKTSVLRTTELDEAAGVIPRVVRTPKPIQAQGRLRANKVRNFLCRQHGVKKRRYKRDKPNKRPSPTKMQKRERFRVDRVSAVTSLAKNPEKIPEINNCKKSASSRQRRLTIGEGKKNVSSNGQIDKLFQLQLKENPGVSKKDFEQHDNIEDISDEEFVGRGPDPCYGLVRTENLNKGNGDPKNSNIDTVLDKEVLESIAGNMNPSDRLSEDPIEEFSDEKPPSLGEHTFHENLLTSPAKNKRNTDRVARNHASGHVDDVATQVRAEQCAPNEQEQGASDLILEGLMSGNNKEQKSLLESKVVSCLDEKEKKNEGDNAPVPLRVSEILRDDAVPERGIQGQYGIISLFDGVPSVVRILKQKLQQPPAAIILAELDEKNRGLVCAEFGYRSDEQWGYTSDGSACCYIRDVNTILKDNCFLLRQVVSMYPNLKWFIVGGSPCQDLTFAGPSQALLGLVGSQSRLFFALLCTIHYSYHASSGWS